MKKSDRELIYNKYGGRCAYCGCELQKGWAVDHIVPCYRTDNDEEYIRRFTHPKRTEPIPHRGKDCIENYNPSCRRCNGWKSTFSVEQFREEIKLQPTRVRVVSTGFRLAEDFKQIQETNNPVVFYFETFSTLDAQKKQN